MSKSNVKFSIQVEETQNRCPVGETIGNRNMAEGKIPVLSCEGACIRGEIARLAANMVAKEEPFARSCHGELLSVPDSAMAQWAKKAEKVVLIDGCFLRCHGRIIENLLEKNKLVQYDALSVYRKYTDVFDIDDVPEAERKEVARQVADSVLAVLRNGD
ncbi:MAG: putative zinc-binding protein [Planctomycetota bacterium]